MKKKLIPVVVLAVALVLTWMRFVPKRVEAQSATTFHYKYESGLLFLQSPNTLSVNVINVGSSTHSAKVIIWQIFSPTTARSSVSTSGSIAIGAGEVDGAGYSTTATGQVDNYQAEIFTDSPEIIPTVTISGGCPGGWPCPEIIQEIQPGQLTKFNGEF